MFFGIFSRGGVPPSPRFRRRGMIVRDRNDMEENNVEIVVVKTDAELKACLAVRSRVFVEEQSVPPELEKDAFDASPAACTHVLAKAEGIPVGTGRWIPYKEADTAKIQRVAVVPEYRGRGVGARLIEALERDARQAGMKFAVLDSQCHAEPFYRRLGYVTISEQPFEEAGIMHVRMKKRL